MDAKIDLPAPNTARICDKGYAVSTLRLCEALFEASASSWSTRRRTVKSRELRRKALCDSSEMVAINKSSIIIMCHYSTNSQTRCGYVHF